MTPILHGPRTEIWYSGHILLGQRIVDAEERFEIF